MKWLYLSNAVMKSLLKKKELCGFDVKPSVCSLIIQDCIFRLAFSIIVQNLVLLFSGYKT